MKNGTDNNLFIIFSCSLIILAGAIFMLSSYGIYPFEEKETESLPRFLRSRTTVSQKIPPSHLPKYTTTQKTLKVKNKNGEKLDISVRGPSYNYSRMLYLLEEYRKVEKNFYSNFNIFVNKLNNLKTLETILRKMKNEKINFDNYHNKVRVFHRRAMPSRKKNSLRYYLRVLDESIDEVENMIEKFRMELK